MTERLLDFLPSRGTNLRVHGCHRPVRVDLALLLGPILNHGAGVVPPPFQTDRFTIRDTKHKQYESLRESQLGLREPQLEVLATPGWYQFFSIFGRERFPDQLACSAGIRSNLQVNAFGHSYRTEKRK
jgi:hypothetical protein